MKHRRPKHSEYIVPRPPEQPQQHCPGGLKEKREAGNVHDQAASRDVGHRMAAAGCDTLSPQRGPASQGGNNDTRQHEHSQSAELNQQQQQCLPGRGKVGRRVHHDQACPAHGTGCRKRGVAPTQRVSAIQPRQQFQAQRSQHDQGQEGCHEQFGGRQSARSQLTSRCQIEAANGRSPMFRPLPHRGVCLVCEFCCAIPVGFQLATDRRFPPACWLTAIQHDHDDSRQKLFWERGRDSAPYG